MMKRKIAVYCRVSSESQDENYSIQEQEKRGIAYAKRVSSSYVVFKDVYTGTKLDRPEFSKFLRKINEFSAIWIIEFTRLSRSVEDSYTLLKIFKENDVQIIMNDQIKIVEKPEEFLNFGIESVIADYERRRIRERLDRGVKLKKESGGLWHPNTPYGYTAFYNDKGEREIMVNTSEADNVVYIFNEVVERKRPFSDICREFNRRGIPPREGSKWWESNISRIVRQPLYAGFYSYKNEEITSTEYGTLVSRELWDKAQIEVKNRNLKWGMRYNHNFSSSLIRCWYCNEKVIFHNKKVFRFKDGEKVSHYYNPQYKINHKKTCKRKVNKTNFRPKELLDYVVTVLFMQFVVDKEELIKYYEKVKDKYKDKEDQLESDIFENKNRLKKINTKKKKLISLFLDDEDIEDQIRELSTKEREIRKIINRLEMELHNDTDRINSILAELSHDLRDRYWNETPYGKRKLVSSFLHDAYIKDNELTWTWITGSTVVVDLVKLRKQSDKAIELYKSSLQEFSFFHAQEKKDIEHFFSGTCIPVKKIFTRENLETDEIDYILGIISDDSSRESDIENIWNFMNEKEPLKKNKVWKKNIEILKDKAKKKQEEYLFEYRKSDS